MKRAIEYQVPCIISLLLCAVQALCRVLVLQGVAEFKLSNKSKKLIDINGIIFVNNCFKQEEIVSDLGAFTVLLGVCSTYLSTDFLFINSVLFYPRLFKSSC